VNAATGEVSEARDRKPPLHGAVEFMQALICESLGGLDELRITEVPEPALRMRDVLVRVHACGLNFPDVLMVQGKYQRKPALPFTPGSEFSGIVESVGADVGEFAAGDRVCCTVQAGGLAEKLAASADDLYALPKGIDMDEAAALLITYSTSLYALRDRAALAEGDCLLVLGAGGGVGLAAVELGKALGAHVVAAASSESKLALARAKGADRVVLYPSGLDEPGQQKAFGAQLKELAGKGGFNVIYDPVGGAYSEPALRSIAWAGRYLVVGFAAGGIPSVALNLPLLKGCQIVGVIWGGATMRDPKLQRRTQEELIGLLGQGRLHPHIGARFNLRSGVEGLQMLADRRALGKIIVHC
jgi:NADPH2:quinone reductase